MNTTNKKQRVHKLLAQLGYGSRREIEAWIKAGQIIINGEIASLGQAATTNDNIILNGKALNLRKQKPISHRVLIYHKPVGEICSHDDPQQRVTIFKALPRLQSGRWISVGRLDINTSGLILITTDGELAHRLMHPSAEIEREYAVRVRGNVDQEIIKRLITGVKLDDGMAAFDSLHDAGGSGSNHWYHVVLKEGRNREVRRLWESQGLQVSRLMRVRFGNTPLPQELRPGHWQELQHAEIMLLRESVGLESINVTPRPAMQGKQMNKGQRRLLGLKKAKRKEHYAGKR